MKYQDRPEDSAFDTAFDLRARAGFDEYRTHAVHLLGLQVRVADVALEFGTLLRIGAQECRGDEYGAFALAQIVTSSTSGRTCSTACSERS